MTAAQFLRNLIEAVPYQIHTVLTASNFAMVGQLNNSCGTHL